MALLDGLRTRVLRDADAGLPSKDIGVKYAVSRAWVNHVSSGGMKREEVGPRKQMTFGAGRSATSKEYRLVALITAQPDAMLAELRDALPTRAALSSTTVAHDRPPRPYGTKNGTRR